MRKERGFGLFEVFVLIAVGLGATVALLLIGNSLFLRRVALDEVERGKAVEGALPLAFETCTEGTLTGTLSVPLYDRTVQVSFSCSYVSSNLMRVEVVADGLRREAFYFVP